MVLIWTQTIFSTLCRDFANISSMFLIHHCCILNISSFQSGRIGVILLKSKEDSFVYELKLNKLRIVVFSS